MKKTTIAIATLTMAANAVQANPYHWQATVRACYAIYAQKWQQEHGAPCGSCSAGWPSVTVCAAKAIFPRVSESNVNWCIDTTYAKYRESQKPNSDDPTNDAMTCVSQYAR